LVTEVYIQVCNNVGFLRNIFHGFKLCSLVVLSLSTCFVNIVVSLSEHRDNEKYVAAWPPE
jgi:hypothetical protein